VQLSLPLHLADLTYALLQHLLVAGRERSLPFQLQRQRLASMFDLPYFRLQFAAVTPQLINLILLLLDHAQAGVACGVLTFKLCLEAHNVYLGSMKIVAQVVKLHLRLTSLHRIDMLEVGC